MAIAAGHIGWSSRGGPGRTTKTRSPAGTTKPGAVPTGSSAIAPSGTIACLRLAAADGLLVEAEAPREAAQDRRNLPLHFLVEHQLAAGEAGDDLRGEVVGGRPQAAGGNDQVHVLGGQEAERRPEVVGAVADHEDVGDIDAQLGQSFGDPGPVAIADPTGQDLRPGHHYPRPNLGHAQVGRSPSGSCLSLPLESIEYPIGLAVAGMLACCPSIFIETSPLPKEIVKLPE